MVDLPCFFEWRRKCGAKTEKPVESNESNEPACRSLTKFLN